MYVRITKYQVAPSMLDDMVARLDEIGAQLSKISGTLVAYNAWNDDGESVVFGIYESEAAAEAAQPRIREIWGELEGLLVGAPEPQTFSRVKKTL